MSTKAILIDSTVAEYTAEEFSAIQKFLLEAGILAESDGSMGLEVTEKSGGADMSVDVSAGQALIEFTKNSTTWKIIGLSNAVENVAVTDNSTGDVRVDAVIMRASITEEPNILKNNIITIEVIEGTGNTALSDGAIDTAVSNDGWIRLADISVPDSTLDIEDGDITDTRIKVATNQAFNLAPEVIYMGILATDPTDLVEGMVWFNSVTHTLNFYNGTTTKQLGGASTTLTGEDQIVDGSDQTQKTYDGTTAFGEADATTKYNEISQGFTASRTSITGAKLYKKADTGTFTGDVTVSLKADDGTGKPTGADLASVTIPNADWLALPLGVFEALFSVEYTGSAGTVYHIVVSSSTSDNSNHPNLGHNTAGGYAGAGVNFNNTTDGWTGIATIDLYFETLHNRTDKVGTTNSNGKLDKSLINGQDLQFVAINGEFVFGEDMDMGEVAYQDIDTNEAYLGDANDSDYQKQRNVLGIVMESKVAGEKGQIALPGSIVTGLNFGEASETVAETTDQNQNSGGGDVNIGSGGSTSDIRQTFITGDVSNLSEVNIWLKKQGTPGFTLTCRVYEAGIGGNVQGSALATRTFVESDLTTGYQEFDILDGTPIDVKPRQKYVIKLSVSSTNASNYYRAEIAQSFNSTTFYEDGEFYGGSVYSLPSGGGTSSLRFNTKYTLQRNYFFGDNVYLSDTAGALSLEPGTYQKKIGRILSEDSMIVEPSIIEELIYQVGFDNDSDGDRTSSTVKFPVPRNARYVLAYGYADDTGTAFQDYLKYPLRIGASTTNNGLGNPKIVNSEGGFSLSGSSTITVTLSPRLEKIQLYFFK